MQPRRSAPNDEPIIDVRILVATGQPEKRSAVFADAGLLEAVRWMVEAAAAPVIGNATWAGVRGLALSRQRSGRPSLRFAAHAVARRFVAECFADAVQELPYEEEMLADGCWRLHFNSEPPGRRYVVTTKSARMSPRKQEPKVAEAKRVDVGGEADERPR